MTKFEKLVTMIFFIVALIGTDKGWLPGLWAVVFVIIGCVGLDKWVITRAKGNHEES